MGEKYDSTEDTLNHIKRIRELLSDAADELMLRGQLHDKSKLSEPEKSIFDEYTPKLKGCTYGSDEYKQYLVDLKDALDHHYANNSHHPEHYENGINGMNLLDLVEMLFDWKASSERHDDGDIYRSIDINAKRFNIPDYLVDIFKNTVKNQGWK
ncbi:DUF5662 family protein [Nanoarchaeota archaeon]